MNDGDLFPCGALHPSADGVTCERDRSHDGPHSQEDNQGYAYRWPQITESKERFDIEFLIFVAIVSFILGMLAETILTTPHP